MGRGRIQKVRVHMVQAKDYSALTDDINELQKNYIRRRLKEWRLSPAQQLSVLDGILTRAKEL